ncbi:MAG: hypothetical protein NTX72_04395 [Candidatus Uhrbacteria bacterium]|nr:hypothetical protein [Candidatus Uhrbacteria bacterium]
MLHDELKQSAKSLTSFLETHLTKNGFSSRTFYGEIFTAVASQYCDSDRQIIQDALSGHQKKLLESEDARNHQEFHIYAYALLNKAIRTSLPIPNIHFSHTIRAKPTNWILLRGLAKIRFGSAFDKWFWKKILPIVIRVNDRDGFILDRGIGALMRGEEKESHLSDQYQAFMLVVLTDLYELTHNPFYLTTFRKGLNALLAHQKETAEVIRFGRGRGQIFGYGSLVYALSWSLTQDGPNSNETALQKTCAYLFSFQNEDGSFPLVLTKGDDPSLWESYNNLFDYLPFLAVMLWRSSVVLSKNGERFLA